MVSIATGAETIGIARTGVRCTSLCPLSTVSEYLIISPGQPETAMGCCNGPTYRSIGRSRRRRSATGEGRKTEDSQTKQSHCLFRSPPASRSVAIEKLQPRPPRQTTERAPSKESGMRHPGGTATVGRAGSAHESYEVDAADDMPRPAGLYRFLRRLLSSRDLLD